MEGNPPPLRKKGLGPLGWIGIGCGGIVFLLIVAGVVAGLYFGKDTFAQFKDNPTKATATTMIKVSMGQMVMAAEDDTNKRYTVRDKNTGKQTTVYWDAAKKAPAVIPGDFSAIPSDIRGDVSNAPPEK